MMEKIEENFNSMPEHFSQDLLIHQSSWQDMFQKNIYKSELKSGNIKFYREVLVDYSIALDEDILWKNEPFNRIISEWITKIPIFDFVSIGHYLCFYGTIYFEQYADTKLVLSCSSEINLKDKLQSFQSCQNWEKIAKFLFHQIYKN